MDSNLQKYFETITLHIVENHKVDLDGIFVTNAEGAHMDFGVYLIQARYRKLIESINKVGPPTQAMKERALIHARQNTLDWLMREGRGLIDRTTAYLYEEAERTGWFRSDYFGWNDINDMVASIVDQTSDDGGDHWSWLTFYKKILPAAQAAGIPTGVMTASTSQVRKLRHNLVPGYNELEARMQSGALTSEEGEKVLSWMLDMTANPNIKSSEMKKEIDKWRGLESNVPDPLEGTTVMVSDDEIIYMMTATNRVEARMIENALRGKVEFTIVGLKHFIKMATQIIGLERMQAIYDNSISEASEN